MGKVEETLAEGLSKLAHAIRRSTAAYIAMNMTPSDGTMDDWEEHADRVAAWIGGTALAKEQAAVEERGEASIGSPGVPWSERDQA